MGAADCDGASVTQDFDIIFKATLDGDTLTLKQMSVYPSGLGIGTEMVRALLVACPQIDRVVLSTARNNKGARKFYKRVFGRESVLKRVRHPASMSVDVEYRL